MGINKNSNKQTIIKLSKEFNSFYLYDEKYIITCANELKNNFKNVHFLYSIKANPNPMVLDSVLKQGFGVDAASVKEVMLASNKGLASKLIQYSAPGKTIQDIEITLNHSIIIADSLSEIKLINKIAQNQSIKANIGIRINPDFSFDSITGSSSKFGIDVDQLFSALSWIKQLNNINIIGFHIHLQSQELNVERLENYYENIFNLALSLQHEIKHPLQFINMGSGLGIPYASEDKPLDITRLGKKVSNLMESFSSQLSQSQIYIETGRYLVGSSGTYITKVLDKKISCGKNYAILHNTLNGFMRLSLSQLVNQYNTSNNPKGTEPLFTSANAFSFTPFTSETEMEKITLVGNLCTSADIIAKDIILPKLKPGDLITIPNAGCYAASLSPIQFSSQTPPPEVFLTSDGREILTKRNIIYDI